MPIDHFVVVMMENRSFDHYFGWLSRRGRRRPAPDASRTARASRSDTRHASHDRAPAEWIQGLRSPRPRPRLGPGARSSRTASWPRAAATTSSRSLLQRGRARLHPPAAAQGLHVYDRWFCSVLGLDLAEPLLQVVGPVGREQEQHRPAAGRQQWETIFDRAIAKGVTARYYNSDLPFSAHVRRARRRVDAPDLASTTPTRRAASSPNITFVDPPFRDGGGFDGNSADEHPHGDVRLGQAFMADVVNAFIELAALPRGARCSSSTTSGAASSTTCGRRACRTTGPAPTSTRTSPRWASASPRWRLAIDAPPLRRTRAAGSTTARTGSSRSSS